MNPTVYVSHLEDCNDEVYYDLMLSHSSYVPEPLTGCSVIQYVSQHIERDQLSLKIKIDFLLIPKWLFFHLNFDAKFLKSGIVFLRYGNFIEDVITNW